MFKKFMIIVVSALVLLVIAAYVFMQQAQFGRQPQGERLVRVEHSPHYRDGEFQNLHDTPSLTEGASYFAVFWQFFFAPTPRKTPTDTIPSTKTNLHTLDPQQDVLVWFGHSSYFIQTHGKKILVDPVFCGHASPFSFTTNAFAGTERYTVDDIPHIDYLLISHDHWDHLDYTTILALKSKVKHVICGLGTGEHLEYWGYDPKVIHELDWGEHVTPDSGFTIHATAGRHFSGRGFTRNKALWVSFVLHTPSTKLFIGGDSGYDTHFADIGQAFGPFDLAILENGQYDPKWKYIHMMPEQVLQAAQDLKARRLFPVHSSKFALANHPWDESLIRITKANKDLHVPLATPIIGEAFRFMDSTQVFTEWWTGLN